MSLRGRRAGHVRSTSAPEACVWRLQWQQRGAAAGPAAAAAAATDAAPPLEADGRYPPALLARYELSLTLGYGGFSKVKLAKHRLTGLKVRCESAGRSAAARAPSSCSPPLQRPGTPPPPSCEGWRGQCHGFL